MNTSLLTADPATHVKIVVVSMLAAILVVLVRLDHDVTRGHAPEPVLQTGDVAHDLFAHRANGFIP